MIENNCAARATKEKREREKLSLRDASKECGISASTLSRIERGVVILDTKNAVKLSKWSGVSLENLLSDF